MTEIEALNGAVVHLARKFGKEIGNTCLCIVCLRMIGLSTPYCETLFHLIKAMEPEQDKKQTT